MIASAKTGLFSNRVGIRLTQGMPASCGRTDLIPAGHTAYCGHLSEADTHLKQFVCEGRAVEVIERVTCRDVGSRRIGRGGVERGACAEDDQQHVGQYIRMTVERASAP